MLGTICLQVVSLRETYTRYTRYKVSNEEELTKVLREEDGNKRKIEGVVDFTGRRLTAIARFASTHRRPEFPSLIVASLISAAFRALRLISFSVVLTLHLMPQFTLRLTLA